MPRHRARPGPAIAVVALAIYTVVLSVALARRRAATPGEPSAALPTGPLVVEVPSTPAPEPVASASASPPAALPSASAPAPQPRPVRVAPSARRPRPSPSDVRDPWGAR